MAITSLSDYYGAARQRVVMQRTATVTSVALFPFSVFSAAGAPGAGTLAGTSTTAGVVPTDATAGCPVITAFGGGASGYLAAVEFTNTVSGRLSLYDMLWKGGAYPFNASVTLSSQPSYSSRVPGGTDFGGCQIWLETVTAFTGNQSIAVTYEDAVNGTGRTTGTIATGVAPTIGRMRLLNLQAGDYSPKKIESVTGTVATVGTFNVLVLRPLWSGRVSLANEGETHGPERTGMIEVFADSALVMNVQADSTSTGLPLLSTTILNK
jgi:hypothetical protein